MIPFNWRHLFRQAFRSVIGTAGTHRRLTPHRIIVLIIFWVLFIPHQIVTRLCLLLDNLFFPGWRKTPVSKPLFITGVFRSGTTYLHRMLAGDKDNFSTFLTWEIYLAPSIIQRKILRLWRKIDRLTGSPAMKWLKRYDRRSLGEVRFHQVGLWKEEEDEGLFLFLWDSFFTWFFFPDSQGTRNYRFADREVKIHRQDRKFRFYANCIRRHLYVHEGAAVYLSKNPAFTPELDTLRRIFPDARIIYMVRDPRRVLVSQAVWFSFCWHYFASPTERYPFRDELLEMTLHWYRYPLELFDKQEGRRDGDQEGGGIIVEYRDMIADPRGVIARIYRHFNLKMSSEYTAWIDKELTQNRRHPGAGEVSLEDIGYDTREIEERFADVLRRFDFSKADRDDS